MRCTSRLMLKSLKGKSFLVTGASSGLGEAVMRHLTIEHGANVTVLDVAESKTALPGNATFVKTDVTSEDSVRAAIKASMDKFGTRPHGVVNCAGVAPPAKVLGKKGVHSLDMFEKVVKVNLIGTFNVCRLGAEAMVTGGAIEEGEQDRGVIINTASIAAFEGQVGQAAYASSKCGVVGLTLPLAREFQAHGIRVNVIAPGIFKTPMMAGLPQAAQDSLAKSVPFPKRLGNPEEFARLVAHISTNEYLNGEHIRLDGSLRMQ